MVAFGSHYLRRHEGLELNQSKNDGELGTRVCFGARNVVSPLADPFQNPTSMAQSSKAGSPRLNIKGR